MRADRDSGSDRISELQACDGKLTLNNGPERSKRSDITSLFQTCMSGALTEILATIQPHYFRHYAVMSKYRTSVSA